ncbi:hypothetical protein GCM10022224_095400 [Nonomuraea antimicrobica]|uniref:CU044_5270 family protein n=1 Tax=Nonomuraea antimicrobica TaxID=561173 RepID=A0ABP7E5Q3_9ACTN
MDDLELLRELRADVPAPSAERLRVVRARALRRRARLRAVPFLLTAATVTVAAVLVGAVAMTGAGSPPAGPTATLRTKTVSAQAVLQQAAWVVQRRRPAAAPRPEQWIYRKRVVRQPGGSDKVEEYWTRYDGLRQAHRQGQGPIETRTYTPDPADDDLTPQEFAAKLAALPTDPRKLLAQVKADPLWAAEPEGRPAEPADVRAFRVLSVYLDQEVPLPPELHAAIFRAMAEIPGVRVDAGVRDAAGRAGIGIAYEPGPAACPRCYNGRGLLIERSYIILDPTTYAYLGRHVVQFQDYIVDGEVAVPRGADYLSAELARGIVDRPALPR